MNCPNCDHILGGMNCQACGWRYTDPFPPHRKHPMSSFPFKAHLNYPAEGQVPGTVTSVEEPLPAIEAPAVNFTGTVESAGTVESEPVTLTVQGGGIVISVDAPDTDVATLLDLAPPAESEHASE